MPLNLYIREMYNCYCRSSSFGAVVTLGNSFSFVNGFLNFMKKKKEIALFPQAWYDAA